MTYKNTQSGFTLVEAMIAMGIIVTGLVALVALAWVSVVAARTTNEQFIASTIAQEGMEATRALRDTNWLAFDTDSSTSVYDGLQPDSGIDYTAVLTQDLDGADDTRGQWLIDFGPNTFGDTCIDVSGEEFDCTAIWENEVTNRYTQRTDENFDLGAHVQTPYQRLIQLFPICRDPEDDSSEVIIDNETDTCATQLNGGGDAYEQVGVNVIVTVQWQGRSGVVDYILEERMYDWKY